MIKYINLFFIFLLAPILGFFFAFYEDNSIQAFDTSGLAIPVNVMEDDLNNLKHELILTQNNVSNIRSEVRKVLELAHQESISYEIQKSNIDRLVDNSKKQTKQSDIVLEQVLSNLLGEPISTHEGENSTIKVYTLIEAGYRGYMAKVRPHTSEALQLVLADDQVVSNGEATSKAAERTGGILAVNAGGYWKTSDGKMAPLGITVVDGEIVTFYENPKLSFVGFNKSGQLVGGKYQTPEQIKEDNILQGSSFVPTLLQDGEKMDIPSDWANTRHPRTIVGNFSNGELLFIVIDGRRDGWSKGVTLEEVQDKLLSFKVKDAFNLDGGGSSAFYYDGEVLNKPSDGNERPVTSNLIILP